MAALGMDLKENRVNDILQRCSESRELEIIIINPVGRG